MTPEATSATPKKRAPMLYAIVAFKLIKGTALVLIAVGVFSLANKDLSDVFDQFLRWVHLDPERSFFQGIGDWLDTIQPASMKKVALGTFLCGLFLIMLGLGLAFRAKWAIWLAIGESAFFIPIEVFELVRRRPPGATERPYHEFFNPQAGLFLVLAVNVLIVWYLYKNRERLFRHHH